MINTMQIKLIMGCCIVTTAASEIMLCDFKKDEDEVIEKIQRQSTKEQYPLNSSSSIIMFEGVHDDNQSLISYPTAHQSLTCIDRSLDS